MKAPAVTMPVKAARIVLSKANVPKDNRQFQISFQLLQYRRQARENLTSDSGKQLRARRLVEVETVFGHIKHNMGFRRFHFKGLQKVDTEWGLVYIAHNMRKLAG
jgi:hypothetical protein